MLQSAEGWVRDFHLDGLRLDAIHAIFDAAPSTWCRRSSARVHALDPRALVIAESGLNDPKVVRPPERGGWGCDAAWADDFHHALRVLLTGDRDGYYAEFGELAQLAKAYRRPHVHDGGYSTLPRAAASARRADDVAPERFVVFAQNHDQVGNRALGDRLPAEARPLAAFCTLLSPFTPMLFMGEEHGEPAPFQFFSDHIDEEIAIATREGRRREFAAFAEFAGEEVPDPQDPATFERSKLTREGDPAPARPLRAAARGAPRDGPRRGARRVRRAPGLAALRRGEHLVLANFSATPVHVPVDRAGELVLATAPRRRSSPATSCSPPLSGALVR